MVCAVCSKECIRTGPVQKYCKPCSATRDRARKTAWVKENPAPPLDPVKRKERRDRRHVLGAAESVKSRASMAWMAEDDYEPTRTVRVAVPFTGAFSKNAIWSMGRTTAHVYVRQEVKAARAELARLIRSEGVDWFEGKVWIDIFVEKPNARFDAVNVIDLVCDAVKDGIGVDDRWFCVRGVDWSIVKQEPRILVGVSQEVTEHHRCCSYCGAIKPLTEFNKNRSGPLGHARTCRDCSSSVRRAA
jgi:hypothetical protein